MCRPSAFKRKLKHWGYTRNISRPQAFALLRAAANNPGDESISNDAQKQPAKAAQLERYLRRNKLVALQPPKIAHPLPSPHVWKVPEEIFHASSALIRGSFESSHWASTGDELIIQSSTNQDIEKIALHSFLSSLDLASKAASSGHHQLAGTYWTRAFGIVENILVTGQYHDILPNLLQKINDLNAEGHTTIATKLQGHLAAKSKSSYLRDKSRSNVATILQTINLVHLSDMPAIEERIMSLFVTQFDSFLGLCHYNSFVLRMNYARRQLLRNDQATLTEYIPSLDLFDGLFGTCNRRSLDIVRLRMEVLHHRGNYARVEGEAKCLVERAGRVRDDVWLRLYFLIKGYYHLGIAEYLQGQEGVARGNIVRCIELINEFDRIDPHGMFAAEKAVLEDFF